jgi:hypothetical protein
VRKGAQLSAGALDIGVRMWDGGAMTSIRQSRVLWPIAITLLVLAVANVAAVVGNWPVSRSVSGYGFLVLGAGVFALLYWVEPDSFRPAEGRKLAFWGIACAIVFVGTGAGLTASILKPHGVLMLVTAIGAVAVGVGLGAMIEAHPGLSAAGAAKSPEGA